MSQDTMNDQQDVVEAVEQSATRTDDLINLECLTICECSGVYEQIKKNITDGKKVVIDLHNCQEIDTAGLQLLACIQNDPALSLNVTWTRLSEVLSMKAERLGLLSWISAGIREA